MEAMGTGGTWSTTLRTTGEMYQTHAATELWREISNAAWQCADPGVQFDDTIQRWHTCKASDRINASNPCVTGDTLVATADGWRRIDSLVGSPARIIGADGQAHFVTRIFPTGRKGVFRLRTRGGFELRLTAEHKVLTVNRGDIAARELVRGDRLQLQG